MSWEVRGGMRYYTRSSRVNGRVVREYFGGGALGEVAAKLDAAAKTRRQRELDRVRELECQANDFDEVIAAFDSSVDALARAMLIDAGYHQHNRGEWRKRNE
ncbi:hypothetical protein OAU26_08195 [Mariniblastus sp.]|nr:hypothetical protein [Mariniblastus sp.]